MTEELVKYEAAERGIKVFQPVMSIEEMKDRYQMMARITSEIMREDQDYGAIPGTGSKPSLLKPGAEKLATFFGLRKEFTVTAEEDWTGAEHGEPHFYYLVRCSLYRDDVLVAAADGSCNSWESRYRWRKAARICPQCKSDAIIKGKDEYGGGWLCFKKKGGCGAKFKDGDKSIEGQQTGRVLNADIFDQVNTILKMAEKRALVAAVLLAVGASEFFTQDMEDIIDAEWTEHILTLTDAKPEYTPQQEPQPRQETVTQTTVAQNGHLKKQDADRPWDAQALRAKILGKVRQLKDDQDVPPEQWHTPPEPGHAGVLTGKLNGILGGDNRRHTCLEFVFGDASSKQLEKPEIEAMLRYIAKGSPETVTDELNRLVNAVVTADAVGTLPGMSAAVVDGLVRQDPDDIG